MARYVVRMTTMAYMNGSVEVEADSPKAAETAALKHAGDITWKYDGIAEGPDQGPEVSAVEEDHA